MELLHVLLRHKRRHQGRAKSISVPLGESARDALTSGGNLLFWAFRCDFSSPFGAVARSTTLARMEGPNMELYEQSGPSAERFLNSSGRQKPLQRCAHMDPFPDPARRLLAAAPFRAPDGSTSRPKKRPFWSRSRPPGWRPCV